MQAQVSAITNIEGQLRRVIDVQTQMLADVTVCSTERQQIKNQQNCAMGMLENIQNQLEDVEDKLEMAMMKLEERAKLPQDGVADDFEKSASDCLEALFLTDPVVDKREIENRKGLLLPHSCDWALDLLGKYLFTSKFDRFGSTETLGRARP